MTCITECPYVTSYSWRISRPVRVRITTINSSEETDLRASLIEEMRLQVSEKDDANAIVLVPRDLILEEAALNRSDTAKSVRKLRSASHQQARRDMDRLADELTEDRPQIKANPMLIQAYFEEGRTRGLDDIDPLKKPGEWDMSRGDQLDLREFTNDVWKACDGATFDQYHQWMMRDINSQLKRGRGTMAKGLVWFTEGNNILWELLKMKQIGTPGMGMERPVQSLETRLVTPGQTALSSSSQSRACTDKRGRLPSRKRSRSPRRTRALARKPNEKLKNVPKGCCDRCNNQGPAMQVTTLIRATARTGARPTLNR